MPTKTIVDASVPNAGRIYDYLLGGHHNFEIDRRTGDRIRATLPALPKVMRMFRWCLQDVATQLTYERGFDTIVDFASGLPTADHMHTAVAPDTKIVYSDRDSVCVEYGQEILGGTPNIVYFQADCRYPDLLLNRPEVQEFLGGKRRVAVIYWGISMFLADEEIRHIAQTLYDWTAPGSVFAFYLQLADAVDPTSSKVIEMYRQMGEELHFRSVEECKELMKPWVADAKGWVPMETWHGIEPLSPEERQQFPQGVGYGVYLVKGE
ncbi:MAG: SAM-dependent methyltransferase [Anaerolineae bacterium]|nr:SAM-dependent methyltransferase [Anaerolineae bacterium]